MRSWMAAVMLLLSLAHRAQDPFELTGNRKEVSIPFRLVNNLIIIPVNINGTQLDFLLDTGVEENILFSLEEKELPLYNVEKIELRGLGSEESVEGLKSVGNTITLRGLKSANQIIYVVLDDQFDFSASLGVPVNGIIGYRFFRDHPVVLDYARKRLRIYNRDRVNLDKVLKGYVPFDLTIEKSKPYVTVDVGIDSVPRASKLLLDTGNSDALWLFPSRDKEIQVPDRRLRDFLGRGFSGEIYGDKARISRLQLKDFVFKRPIAAFPDTTSVRHVRMVERRVGSIGGEILKRFTVCFDYSRQKMYLKRNSDFSTPFTYNMSGITLHHAGHQVVQERADSGGNRVELAFGEKEVQVSYRFALKPLYIVVSVRENSPAYKAGVRKGDLLKRVNGRDSYQYSLQEINTLLKSEEGRHIEVEVERDGKSIDFKFDLEELL